MKLMRFIGLVIIITFLCACQQVGITSTQVISPQRTIDVTVTPHVMPLISTIPATEVDIKPTITEEPDLPVLTSVGDHEIQPITETLTITIIYDNNPYDQRLSTAWGFSVLIEHGNYTLLFDTGGDGRILMENVRLLGIDPTRIASVVLSHAHDDHTGGLTALLDPGTKPVVYLFPSFPLSFKRQIEQYTQVNEVSPGQSLAEGLWTTGEISGAIPEQALVIQTAQGLVVITGCAHPGIVAILEKVREMWDEPIHLVMGGFHLVEKSEAEIDGILEDFHRLGVEQVAPSHCTGEYATSRFADEYEQDFLRVGAGSVIQFEAMLSK